MEVIFKLLRIGRRKRTVILWGLFVFVLWILYWCNGFLGNLTHKIADIKSQPLISSSMGVFNDSMVHEDVHALPVDKRLFQSIVEQEFPSTPGNHCRIPHIIHQIYTDENIPHILTSFIESCVRKNPAWKYMFWTHATGQTLIKRTHPYLLDAYNRFSSSNRVKKNDLLRWVVLYEFGGFYADMDVSCLRPLDIATKRYACIVPAEPFEHATHNGLPYLLNVAILFCRPKHPFIKFLLKRLATAGDKGNPVIVTGPVFITKMFRAYNNITAHDMHSIKTDLSSNSPSFYKGVLAEIDNDAVYVPNSQYFIDTIGPVNRIKIEQTCYKNNLLGLMNRECLEFKSRQKVRQSQKFTFTVHHWFHLWSYKSNTLQTLETVPIHYVVPNRIIYR